MMERKAAIIIVSLLLIIAAVSFLSDNSNAFLFDNTFYDAIDNILTGYVVASGNSTAQVGLTVIVNQTDDDDDEGGGSTGPGDKKDEIKEEKKEDNPPEKLFAKLEIIEIYANGVLVYGNGENDLEIILENDELLSLDITLRNNGQKTLNSISVSGENDVEQISVNPSIHNFLLENGSKSFKLILKPKINSTFQVKITAKSLEASDNKYLTVRFEPEELFPIEIPQWIPPVLMLPFLGLFITIIIIYFFIIKKLSNYGVFQPLMKMVRKTYIIDEKIAEQLIRSRLYANFGKIHFLSDSGKKYDSMDEVRLVMLSPGQLLKAVRIQKKYNIDYKFAQLLCAALSKFNPFILTNRDIPAQIKADFSKITFENPFEQKVDIDLGLMEYIKTARSKNISDDVIRARLIDSGWKEDIVKLALEKKN